MISFGSIDEDRAFRSFFHAGYPNALENSLVLIDPKWDSFAAIRLEIIDPTEGFNTYWAIVFIDYKD